MKKAEILIIDDELDNRRNLKIILEARQYSVLLAENGSEGVRLAREFLPDLILCDITMPGLDGYQVFSQLVSDLQTAIIPFIFLTARTDAKDIRAGLKLGADDYLPKPIKTKELIETIEMRLGKLANLKETFVNKTEDITEPGNKLTSEANILLNYKNEHLNIPVKDIIYIEAENQYSKVCIRTGKNILGCRSLDNWEDILPDDLFIRIHRSTILNINEVEKLVKESSNTMRVILKDKSKSLTVSQRFVKKIKSRLNFL